MVNRLFSSLILIGLVSACARVDGAWGGPTVKRSQICKSADEGQQENSYAAAMRLLEAKSWDHSAKEFEAIIANYPRSSFAHDSYFFLGVCFFQMEELDLANEAFSNYLKAQTNPPYFLDAIRYKFAIAERFRAGMKKRGLSAKQLPKWFSGYGLAAEIYDEVSSSIPYDPMAVEALFGKADVLWKDHDYQGAVEAYQALIARFPKDELASDSFLMITRVYIDQAQNEFQNPDLLALAEINLRRFEKQFPQDSNLDLARADLLKLKEVFAGGLYEIATFYERIDEPRAAVLYYQKAILDFPETKIAICCRDRLAILCPQALKDLEKCYQDTNKRFEEEPLDEIDFLS